METLVEHTQPPAGPSASTQRPAFQAAPPASPQRPSKLQRIATRTQWSAARQAAVAAAAAAVAALVRRGWLGAAVLAARLMVGLGLAGFLADVIVLLATTGRAAAAGAVCMRAAELGTLAPVQQVFSFQAVQQLCLRLLTEGHAAAAAAVAEACWHIAGEVGMQPVQVARLLAAPAVAAADRGSVDVVATVVQLLFGSRMQPLLVWLLVEMVEGMDRPDAAAAVALACLQEEGGAVLVGDLAALLAADGHHRTAAGLAHALYDGACSLALEQEAAGALAAGTAQAVEAGSAGDAVAVQWLLFEGGHLAVLRETVAALTAWPGGCAAAGRLSWSALSSGRERLAAATSVELLLAGRVCEAAGALEALSAASGQHPRVARLGAAVLADAVDGGAAAAAAAANARLWACGLTPLLRDVLVAAARQGRAHAAAKVCRQALEQGHGQMVADVAAAVVVEGAVEEAGRLAGSLAMEASFSPAVIQALGAAMVAAVHAGAAGHAAAVAAELLHEGHQDLLGDITAHLAETGHGEELAQLAGAALELRHGKVSAAELAGLLGAAARSITTGGPGPGEGPTPAPARAITRAARGSGADGLKTVGRSAEATAGGES